jgi:hypothetical protein
MQGQNQCTGCLPGEINFYDKEANMAKELTRMWINQPSTLQELHALNGTNVLAIHEYDNTMRIYFLSGDRISQQVNKMVLSNGWRPSTPVTQETLNQEEVVEVVSGLHKALSRMVDAHDPDSIEAEWLAHSNGLIRKLTGHDIPAQSICTTRPGP